MNLHVLHKVGFTANGINPYQSSRRKRRRRCSSCRTYLHRSAARCNYCGRRSLTGWHIALGVAILLLSLLFVGMLNSASI